MAEKKVVKNKAAENNTVDIADFFTTTREKDGVWIEPKMSDVGVGFEFRVVGPASPLFLNAVADYLEAHAKVVENKDRKTAYEEEVKAVVERNSAVVTGLRVKKGNSIRINGRPLAYSKETVREILYESSEIRDSVWNAVTAQSTFMKKS